MQVCFKLNGTSEIQLGYNILYSRVARKKTLILTTLFICCDWWL